MQDVETAWKYVRESNPQDLVTDLGALRMFDDFTWREALLSGSTQLRNAANLKTHLKYEHLLALRQVFYRLQELRNQYNAIIRVTSAYRDPETNNQVGGASASVHTKGWAVDFVVDGVNPNRVQKGLEHWGGGMSMSPKFTHLDIRDFYGEEKARWNW
jgi:uncharacterized protein YcbK (DUF882 family)